MQCVHANGGDEHSTPSFRMTRKASDAYEVTEGALLGGYHGDEGDEHSTPSTQ